MLSKSRPREDNSIDVLTALGLEHSGSCESLDVKLRLFFNLDLAPSSKLS